MLFGQWDDQNGRQKKIIKSKMYKQMLDNQILINQKYKKQKDSNKQYRHLIHPSDKRFPPNFEHKNNHYNLSQYDNSYQIQKNKAKNINLPALKDRNTYLHGESKFVKVDQPITKSIKNHFKTQLIQQQSQDLDEYNSTCQKIIRQLQSINKQTPKMKFRRKLYQYSDLAPNRKRYQNMKIQELKSSQIQIYNNYDHIKTNIKTQPNIYDQIQTKIKSPIDEKYPSFSYVKPSKQQKQYSNNQGSSSMRSKSFKPVDSIKNQIQKTKFKPLQDPVNEFEEQRQIQTNLKSPQKIINQSISTKNPKDMKDISPSPKLNNLQKSRIKSNIQIPKNPSLILQQEKRSQVNTNNLKIHKQNFIQLLRKVKNRGQSLFVKLNAFPKQQLK